MGSIPIVEASPGLDRALHQLPALIVRNLAQRLTPALLNHVAHLVWLSSPSHDVSQTSLALNKEIISDVAPTNGRGLQQPQRWPWRFESLTGAYWTALVSAAAVSAETSSDVDGWVGSGRQAGADDPTCHCWFPAGVCVDLPQCRDSGAH